MKKADIFLAGGALALAAGVYLFYSAGAEAGGGAEVTVDGKSAAFLPLNENDSIRIETPQGYNIVAVEDGTVMVTDADCRDQICVEHKKISRTGETIVCLPHKLVVEITGDSPAAFDMVVGQ